MSESNSGRQVGAGLSGVVDPTAGDVVGTVSAFHWPPGKPWKPDWWKCQRVGPVSGRYQGKMTWPSPNRYQLDLRVDIDPRDPTSPVMDRVSADVYEWFPRLSLLKPWRVYRLSWIVDTPVVSWSECSVEITGEVRIGLSSVDLHIRIPWGTYEPAGPAEVTLSWSTRRAPDRYTCSRTSDCFRDLTLEVDVCNSVDIPPVLPAYDTHGHPTRPAGLQQRTLTMERAYWEAGVDLTIRPERTIIDDSAAEFDRWTVAELHDAMETFYSQFPSGWPKWQMWGMLAGTYDDDPGFETSGVMFDAAAGYGGAGEVPERQGFAVFRNHSWYIDLPAGAPTNDNEATALRAYVRTWVHEAGHAFNLVHSWNKDRPDALSWMNYPQRYDDRNGANSYWSNFMFRFDDEELIHVRHGHRHSVIMGGGAWATGFHEWAPAGAFAEVVGEAPLELLLRSQGHFAFMEPVTVEVRLRNLLPDTAIDVDARLDPADGGVICYIRRPDGRTVEYGPVLCKIGSRRMLTLEGSAIAVRGEDRYSEEVSLSYGTGGFYFSEPGEYLVRAVYQGPGDMYVPSNVLRLRVGIPRSADDERLAQDYFSYQVGMSLYMHGSRSPYLAAGAATLEEVAERYQGSVLGAKAAEVLASSVGRPFFRVADRKDPVLKKFAKADPKRALSLTSAALAVYRREDAKELNLAYHRLVAQRKQHLVALGRYDGARKEVAQLAKDLEARGVNRQVLDRVKAYGKDIPKTKSRSKRTKRR